MSRRASGIAAATALLAVGGFAAWHNTWDRYATAVGEQRSVSLDDGSMIYINTRTRVDVRYSAEARELRLVGGEALFKVEPDPARPFRVRVNGAVVEAVGTQFNIYRKPHQAIVTVIEGAVRAGAEQVNAGQAVTITMDGRITAPAAADVGQATAWRQRRLVFEWETLETIAAEFNRYNRAPRIRVEGEDALFRRYTAVFDADNPRTLVRFLTRDGDLAVTDGGEELVIRSR